MYSLQLGFSEAVIEKSAELNQKAGLTKQKQKKNSTKENDSNFEVKIKGIF